MIARMLWAKGVSEYVDAARAVRQRYPKARFQILGIVDEGTKGAISYADINGWVREGVIEFLGSADDVRGAASLPARQSFPLCRLLRLW